jgi:hypothetical protein
MRRCLTVHGHRGGGGSVTPHGYPVEVGCGRHANIDKGLIGFDVGTGSDIVRPELLRLVNRGNQTTAEKQSFALAA